MNKTLIKWIAIIAVTAIAAVIAVVIINNSKNTPVSAPADTEAPIYVSYCTGGGMDGSRYFLSFSIQDGKAYVIKETQEHPGAKTKTEKKKVDVKCADSLKDIFDFYKISDWEAEPSEDFVLDAATTTISFSFTGGRTYTFSDCNKLPDTFSDAFHDVRYCMLEYAGLEQK